MQLDLVELAWVWLFIQMGSYIDVSGSITTSGNGGFGVYNYFSDGSTMLMFRGDITTWTAWIWCIQLLFRCQQFYQCFR